MYGPSTVRYFRQEALASDVHALSAATIGNLLNAHKINEDAIDFLNGSQNLKTKIWVNGGHGRLGCNNFMVFLLLI